LLRVLKYIAQLLAAGLASFGAELAAGRLLADYPDAAAISPAGVAVAAVLLCGYGAVPVILAAGFFAHALLPGAGYAAAIVPVATTLEACAAGLLIDAWAESRNPFLTTRDIARFVPIAMIATAAGASAGAAIGLLGAAGETAGWDMFAAAWLPWWLRDLASAMIVTPVLTLWISDPPRSFKLVPLLETLFTFAAAAAVGVLVFGPLRANMPGRPALEFLAMLPLIWVALRRDAHETAIAALVLAGTALWGAVGAGASAEQGEQPDFLFVTFMIGATPLSLLLATDVAARRRVERILAGTRQDLRQVREQLAQWHKMEAIGQLTGGVAHDFNNLLTVIIGNLDVGLRQIEARTDVEAERLRRSLNNARRGAVRATAITQRLLMFSRKQAVEARPLNVNNLLAGLSDFLRRSVGETIALDIAGALDVWTVEVDPVQLETAILNLAVNARDAMPEGGRVTIATSNRVLNEDYCRGHEELAPGEYVRISVRDTGVGMSNDVLERVFEPFFTTKDAGRGTGLGLSQVYGFVRQSDGHVAIDSKPGEGTTVSMYLPRRAGHVASAPAPVPSDAADELAPTILVVEDDHDVRSYVVEILRELHFRVLEAHDGDSALGLIGRHDAPVDLLITDLVLPGINGGQLAQEAKARQPGIKLLFISGYSRETLGQMRDVDPSVDILHKPLTEEILEQNIRALLEERPRTVRDAPPLSAAAGGERR